MNKYKKSIILCFLTLMLAVVMPGIPAFADNWKQADDSSWCSESSSFFKKSACEVRELTIDEAWAKITVDASPNGSIGVEGWDKNIIRVLAKVQANADTEETAAEILSEVEIKTGGNKICAEGPKFFGSGKSWSVSYRLMVPIKSNLKLGGLNGGISINDVDGNINANTVNGGVVLKKVSGDVDVNTVNGGVTAELDGDRWQGSGFNAKTTNGGIKVEVPDNYSADLEASTVNGGIHIDFPVKIQGWIKKNINTTLGEGGSPIRLRTVNGGVSVEKI